MFWMKRLMSKSYFISYNKNDIAWAEWVAWIVENLGFQAIIQAWDFTPGKSWTQEMDSAIKRSDSTICILTDDFLNSGFTAAEWQSAFSDDPVGEKQKLILFRVKQCKPDGLLKIRSYADLVGKSSKESRDIIKNVLLGGRIKPSSEPQFPPDHGHEPEFPKSKARYAIVLDGEFDESSKAKVDALIAHLQKKLKDPSITITDISEGSVIVQIESSFESFCTIQKEYFHKKSFNIAGNKVIGIWRTDEETRKPLDTRLEFYRNTLIKFFQSKGADKESSKDLSQDVIVSLYSDKNRYRYLSSSALMVNLARIAFSKCVQEKDQDAIARRGYVNPTGEVDWDEVYRTSIDVLNNLSSEDHFVLEQYWDSIFAEGKFDNDQANEIDAAVEHEIYANFIED
jgi:DNA-directed RNA polymerase specialized sigma24 family protein